MYINMLNILENLPIFEWYFNYKNFILGIMSLVLSMILVASIFWQLDEQLDDNLWGLIDKDTCVKDAIIIGSILIIGMLLNAAGMELKLKLNHMPLVLFFYGSMLLFFIQLIEIIKYKNTFKRIIKITFNIYIKIIECLILMLTLMDRLESIELVVALLSITVMRLLESILESSKKIKILNLNIEKEDCPVKEEKQLFASRQRQLNSICAELKESQGEREPYAIAIAGKWGTGKTSFVNVLKKKIENAEFIHIECTIGHDVEAILNEMSLQMIDKFRDNGIYVPQNGIVEEYFKKVAEFISNMGYDSFSKILEGFMISGEKSYSENKDLMNNELENFYNITKKNIYFIIDDMDRVIDDDVKTQLFQPDKPIYTKVRDDMPARYGLGSNVNQSLIADGCVIEGEVQNSILFRGVKIAKGAKLKNCVIMQDTCVGTDCNLQNVITDKDVMIQDGRSFMGTDTYPVFISKGSIV